MAKICDISGCGRNAFAKGKCWSHHVRIEKGLPVDAPIAARVRNKGHSCMVDGCGKPASHKRRCYFHYEKDRFGGRWKPSALRRHGVTDEAYAEMLQKQGGGCALCGEIGNVGGRNLCVDHDHACCPDKDKSCGGCVRGLLCTNCNLRLGHVESVLNADEWVMQAIAYLERAS